MLSISDPLGASQAQDYHRAQYSNTQEAYYSQGDTVRGEWHGTLAKELGLVGEVHEEEFVRLSEGQHPSTGQQLIRRQESFTYINSDGKEITTKARAAWDLTFSMPKTSSLSGLPGKDGRILSAHRAAVDIALDELEKYVQARMGGNNPSETTGKWIVAKFEHDSSRPVDGVAAPQIHTHSLLFNLTETPDGRPHSLQTSELFKAQALATAVYRAELAIRLKEFGYEIERSPSDSPEIKGYTPDYVVASSPRSQQIDKYMDEHGVFGPEAAQIAAHRTRASKVFIPREEVFAQHQAMAEQYGNQPEKVVALAQERQGRYEAPTNIAELADTAITTAKNRNIERAAVIDERAILADALRHGMGTLRTADAHAALGRSIQAGNLIEVPQEHWQVGRAFTTHEMKKMEVEVIESMLRGRNQHGPIASHNVQEDAIRNSPKPLNDNQVAAVRDVLNCHDQILGLAGGAGTGKTTMLRVVRTAAEESGFEVRGIAPTSRAVLNVKDASIDACTMALHVAQAPKEIQGLPRLYVVDESSLSGTRAMMDFIRTIRSEDRVLLIGDAHQHEAVEAGRPFAQLQEAGMHTAKLTEIVRQRENPALLAVVKDFAAGRILEGVQKMRDQDAIREDTDRKQLIDKMAKHYISLDGRILIVATNNPSRIDISKRIHTEMQTVGRVSKDEQTVKVLVNRQSVTDEDQRWAQKFHEGDVLRYVKSNKTIGVTAREYVHVDAVDEETNMITVSKNNGQQISYDARLIQGVHVFREEERAFAEGDRIQFTSRLHSKDVANREMGTILDINGPGFLHVQMDSGRKIAFNLDQHPHLDYGYGMTSNTAQSDTVDHVLVHVDSSRGHRGLINERMAYVSISRATQSATIYTNDAESLGWELSKDVSHSSALQSEEVAQLTESFNQSSIEHFGPAGMELGGASIGHDIGM
jgi:conjugative relaxase-like TrwC/TraI family protein